MPHQPLNVLVVSPWFPERAAPATGVFVSEQARLVSELHRVRVAAPFRPNPYGWHRRGPERQDHRDVPVHRPRRGPQLFPIPDLVGATIALRRSAAALRRQGFIPDVVHAHVYVGGLVARWAFPRLPIVLTEHHSGVARGELSRTDHEIAKRAFRSADLIAPVSGSLAKAIERFPHVGPIDIIPNAVDTTRFTAKSVSTRSTESSLVFVGGLTPIKGVDTLIRAFGKVLTERPEATLDIVGDGPDRLKLERLVREHGLEASTQFSGHCDRDTVAMKLRAADLLVSASWWENLPGVQLEALASGTPVVATSVGGVPELITHDTGTLVPPGDSDSLARAIHQTLDRHIEPARLRAAVARFAPAVVLARWDDAYRRLAQDHERRLKRRRNKLTNST